jgi:hypothetical protein
MPSLKSIFYTILIISSTFSALGPNDIDIPSDYVSDSSFISMMFKNPKAVNTLYASPSGSGSKCSESSPCSLQTALDNF